MRIIKLAILILIFKIGAANAQTMKIKNSVPFQGLRHFCSSRNKYTYDVNIKGNTFTLTYNDFSIKGTFKNGLVFTNDPDEILNRSISDKKHYGKYYIINAETISILNSENGDYFNYNRCNAN